MCFDLHCSCRPWSSWTVVARCRNIPYIFVMTIILKNVCSWNDFQSCLFFFFFLWPQTYSSYFPWFDFVGSKNCSMLTHSNDSSHQWTQKKKIKKIKHSVIQSIHSYNSYLSLLPILIHIFNSPTITSNHYYLLYICKHFPTEQRNCPLLNRNGTQHLKVKININSWNLFLLPSLNIIHTEKQTCHTVCQQLMTEFAKQYKPKLSTSPKSICSLKHRVWS